MSKGHRHKCRPPSGWGPSGKPPPPPPPGLEAQLAEAVRAGRDRRAWGVAKELLATGAPAAAGPLVGQALELRARAMFGEGHVREALEMVAAFTDRYRAFAGHVPLRLRILLELRGAAPAILQGYGEGGRTEDGLAAVVAAELRDPRWLAGACRLPDGHPLCAQARLVWDAWCAVEQEPARAPEALAALQAVPRRSPLADWRLFVQGLAAFYEGDPDRARANLDRIPESSGAARPAAILRGLLAGSPVPGRAAQALYEAVRVDDLHNQLAGALPAAEGSRGSLALRVERLVSRLLAQGRRGLALDVAALCLAKDAELVADLDALPRHVPSLRDLLPDFAVRIDRFLGWDSGGGALQWLAEVRLRHLSPLEAAILLREQARLRLKLALPNEETAAESDDCFRRSVEAFPLRDTFVEWLAACRQLGRDPAAALDRWRAAFPDDERAHLAALDGARRARDADAIRKSLDALGRYAAGHEAFETVKPFAMAEDAVLLAGAGRHEEAAAAAARLPDTGEWPRIAALSTRYLLASGRPAKRDLTHAVTECGPALAVWHAFNCLSGADLPPSRVPNGIRERSRCPEQHLASLHALARLPDPVWRRMAIESFPATTAGFRVGVSQATAPVRLEMLAALIPLVDAPSQTLLDLGVALTQPALARPTRERESAGDFLAYQAWFGYLSVVRDGGSLSGHGEDELHETLRAARWLITGGGEGMPPLLADLARRMGCESNQTWAGPMNAKRAERVVRRESRRLTAWAYRPAWGTRVFSLPDTPPPGAHAAVEDLRRIYEAAEKAGLDPEDLLDKLLGGDSPLADPMPWPAEDKENLPPPRPAPRRPAKPKPPKVSPNQLSFPFMDELENPPDRGRNETPGKG